MSNKSPHIIQILTDHQSIDTLSCQGFDRHAPATSRLAREGTCFTQATTTTPLCAPARCAMQTGLFATHLGVASNRWSAHAYVHGASGLLVGPHWGIPSIPQYLKPLGYQCGFIGKLHMSGSPWDYGYDEVQPMDGSAAERNCSWQTRSLADYLRSQGMDPAAPLTVDQAERGVHYYRGGEWHAMSGRLLSHGPEHTGSAWLFDEAARLLAHFAAQDKPFLLQVHLAQEPHWPMLVPEPYASLYRAEDMPEVPNWQDPCSDHPRAHARVRDAWRTTGATWAQWAESRAKYLGLMAMIEDQAAAFLQVLDQLGLAQNTLVAWSADHGAANGAHGIFDKDHRLIEETCRIPLLVRWPAGGVLAGQVSAVPAQNLDLLPTYLDAARLAPVEKLHGKSLLPVLRGGTNFRDHAYLACDGMPWGLRTVRAIRTAQRKFIWNAYDQHELYDLELDPYELHNVVDDPAYTTDLLTLKSALLAELVHTEDHMVEFAPFDLDLDRVAEATPLPRVPGAPWTATVPDWLSQGRLAAGPMALVNQTCRAIVPR